MQSMLAHLGRDLDYALDPALWHWASGTRPWAARPHKFENIIKSVENSINFDDKTTGYVGKLCRSII